MRGLFAPWTSAPRVVGSQSIRPPNRPTVLVYQMGKVASASIYYGIRATKQFDVHHLHRLAPHNLEAVRQRMRSKGLELREDAAHALLYQELLGEPRKQFDIITLVREPIARNLSAYFQNMNLFWGDAQGSEIDSDSLRAKFVSEYPHHIPLAWFDDEFRRTTGIDVYAYPFSRWSGYTVLELGARRVLIMRHDLDDQKKGKLIGKFLRTTPIDIKRDNTTESKNFGMMYRKLLQTIRLPETYVTEMLRSKYAAHFYSPRERKRLQQRWFPDSQWRG